MKGNRHTATLWITGYAIGSSLLTLIFLAGCSPRDETPPQRPLDPWAFRSVLDRQPRMLTLALDSSCYVAYDLSRSTIYKVWKGGVTMEGAPYTDRKNVQPTSWGASYFTDSTHAFRWRVQVDGKDVPIPIVSKGYTFADGGITLRYEFRLASGDTISIHEHPEYVLDQGKHVLERTFTSAGIPANTRVSLYSDDSTFAMPQNSSLRSVKILNPLPTQFPPKLEAEFDHRGRYWMEESDCLTCHETDKTTVGPSFEQIAQRYPKEETAYQNLMKKIRAGGSGAWGNTSMNAHPDLSDKELRNMLDYIFSLKPHDPEAIVKKKENHSDIKALLKPGFGAPLEALHPSYTISTLHSEHFRPRVGGLAFLPDGQLLVTTWDITGSVYKLKGVETGDSSKISVTRIATGLAEPLGITVVDGEIYVLQKQELTHLIDRDGDSVVDVYEAVCNQWGVTADFHEFGFGLLYHEGYFYATLSMAMRLLSGEKQQPDRGRTIRIGKDGQYTWVNYGLRTPNGIGFGTDHAIFITDNQGEWLPGNKLIHLVPGTYNGMRWGLPDSLPISTPVVPPAVWLPENEIANSPSEPVLMQDGPYAGQMLHGDVTYGGIQRDFVELVDGAYQGAVFRFTQGLAAGVNRLRWGPDGALYVGEVGMVGGWSWKEKKYGLQRMQYNGNPTFEMLAIRAKPKGFELEFTLPLPPDFSFQPGDLQLQQWWYLPTPNYGGPKMDLENLKITRYTISADRTKVLLEVPGLKEEHVIYFRLKDNLPSDAGLPLWSGEAWYTLNRIPALP